MAKLIPFNDLLDLIEEDPITGAKEAQKRNVSVRIGTYHSSISAGALYRRLKNEPALISAFYGLPFWESEAEGKTTYARNAKHLNKHCHQFVYDAREGSEGKRAEDHAFATQSYFDDDARTLDQILEALKTGGFDGLKKSAPAQEQRNRLKAMESAERKQSGDALDSFSDETSDVGGKTPRTPAGASSGDDPPKASKPKMSVEKVFEHLLITMEPRELRQFQAGHSQVGDRYAIMVERDTDNSSGMLVWRAVEISEMPENDA